ncbi:MAG: RIO1 family regulatory kinase/ATPase [Armatimonadota bacterium]
MPDLQRKDIESKTVRILRPGAGSRPDVRLLRDGSCLMVLKDYSQGNTTLKALGLLLLWREREAYARLDGLPGVPRVCANLGPYALVTEYVESYPASEAPLELLEEAFFQRLRALIESMHRRGVVHGDLKRLDNILITPAGEPYLIDFSAAFWNGSNPSAAFVMPHLVDDDLRAVYKLKQRRVPELLTPDEEVFLSRRSAIERGFRVVREYFRKPVQRFAGSELGKP